MNNNQIDVTAVSYLNIAIAKCKKLMPFVAYNDKTPCWDGDIFVYGDKKHTASDIKKVPVQVKGTTKGKIGEHIKHYVNKHDLKNWSSDGGLIFFVVQIKDDKHKIFYKVLLPHDIQPILNDTKRSWTQKDETLIKFASFLDNEREVSKIMNTFVQNRIVGIPTITREQAMKVGYQIQISGTLDKQSDVHDLAKVAMELNAPTTYEWAVNPSLPEVRIPIEKPDADDGIKIERFIEIDGEIPEYKGMFCSKISGGESVTMHIGSNPIKSKRFMTAFPVIGEEGYEIRIDFKGAIAFQLKDIEWYLEIGASSLGVEKEEKLRSYHKTLSDIKNAVDECGLSFIATDIDYDTLNDEEKYELVKLIDVMTSELEDSVENNWENRLEKWVIWKNTKAYTFLLFRSSIGNGKCKLVNPFTKNRFMTSLVSCREGEKPNPENGVVVSGFMFCGKRIFKRHENTDYDRIYESLTSSDISPNVIDFALKTQCNLISVFDDDETNAAVLDIAHKFGEWIKSNSETNDSLLDCLELNRIQIEKRQDKPFTISDARKLNYISTSKDITHRFAAFTLLEDFNNAEKCLIEMDEDTRKIIDTYPEYALYAKAINEG